jgi:hypothetical protein
MHLLSQNTYDMHLYLKRPKYAFAYAHMQMHNYPKPSYNEHSVITNTRL